VKNYKKSQKKVISIKLNFEKNTKNHKKSQKITKNHKKSLFLHFFHFFQKVISIKLDFCEKSVKKCKKSDFLCFFHFFTLFFIFFIFFYFFSKITLVY